MPGTVSTRDFNAGFKALYRARQGTRCINTAQIHWRDAEGFEG